MGLDWIGGEASIGWMVILLAVAAAVAAGFIERTKAKPPETGPQVLRDGEVVTVKTSGRLVETGPRSRRYRPDVIRGQDNNSEL